MLEVKNLKKTYKTKGGKETKALDDISIKFEEKGLVFLLGKSGSGKSTLLNIIGGLDKPDEGEIIIKGKNSKDFSGSDFDSYRNTFIGFVFQEYNILNEFSVEQNIALALELQGKKNDKKQVSELLESVDLLGFAKRKPNTLSGGQKQRVAIARALIKNPEIIMADEPTGALDSNTGKQVFDTLKKLSEEKLIIVVSHDRDFAEIYGDRIIELKDGKIISDTSKVHKEPTVLNDNLNAINDNVLSIKNPKKLTKDDLEKIYDLIKDKDGEIVITSNDKNVKTIKNALHINDNNKSEIFEETKEINSKDYNPNDTKFVKSHLPFKKAFKMGASSLKTKPIRLIFTIILTMAALIAFGVTSTMMLYDESYSVSESLKDSYYDYEQISKKYKYDQINHCYNYIDDVDEVGYTFSGYNQTYFYQKDLDELNSNHKNKYAGVINFRLNFNDFVPNGYYYKYNEISGLIDKNEDYLKDNNFRIIQGNYPNKTNEIAITKYMYNCLANADSNIKTYDDLIGKTIKSDLTMRNSYVGMEELTISAIIDVGNIPSCFDELRDSNLKSNSYILSLNDKFEDYMDSSFHLLGFVCSDFYDYYSIKYNYSKETEYYEKVSAKAKGIAYDNYLESICKRNPSKTSEIEYYNSNIIKRFGTDFTFKDLDGNDISFITPKKDECYIPQSMYNSHLRYVKNTKDDTIKGILERSYLIPELADIDSGRYYSLLNKDELTKEENDELYSLFDYNYNDKFLSVYNLYLTYRKIFTIQLKKENPNYENDSSYKRVQELVKLIDQEALAKTYNYDAYLSELDAIYKEGVIDRWYLDIAGSNAYLYLDSSKGKKLYNCLKNLNTNEDYKKLKELLDSYGVSYEVYDKVKPINVIEDLSFYYKTYDSTQGELKIIGVYDNHSAYYGSIILSDEFIDTYAYDNDTESNYIEKKTDYEKLDEYKYYTAITKTNFSQDDVKIMLKNYGSYRYEMTDSIYKDIVIFIEMVNSLKKALLITGIVVAIFASLMLFNFISSSISNKTKEIGILRAVGARGVDLFKIFFCESSVITIICIILAVIGSKLSCDAINESMANAANLVLLDFNIINILMIFIGAMVIAAIGTFIPVYIASKKQPVDSIRTL